MEKMNYKMASRATILLGRESVSRADGAIIELIKNAYDADAALCCICFDADNDQIFIIDNGLGMTKEIIENFWMMIGTDNKRINYYSTKRRIKSGEKGIGRFALDRLGSKCTMYTKNVSEPLIRWHTDWSSFEAPGKTLDEIEAEFEYLENNIIDLIPESIIDNINKMAVCEKRDFKFATGTILKIFGLRDNWQSSLINKTTTALEFLVPPVEQTDFTIVVQNDMRSKGYELSNDTTDDYDYRIKAVFNGTDFKIEIERNELDLSVMPKEIFSHPRFQKHPYRYKDLKIGKYTKDYSIPELLLNTDTNYVNAVKELGEFSFMYTFMKVTAREDGRGINYYKSVGRHRRKWLNEHAGIKIYRDNFVIRPYGDKMSNSFDWLGLDARKGVNPVGISDESEQWHVNNSQSQGTVFISRMSNKVIIDKASREGIIENKYFSILCNILRNIISVFEKDRAYISRTIRLHTDEVINRERAKEEAKKLAEKVLEQQESDKHNDKASPASPASANDTLTFARAVQVYEEEVEDLITEIKLLRALATNGLITTSMVHDLKGLNAMLVSRVDTLRFAIENDKKSLVERHLRDLVLNDEFLKAWITVITTQTNRDKRRRLKKDLSLVIRNGVNLLRPILDRKKVVLELDVDENAFERRIFETDFDSIIYNLVINSIESFDHANCESRIIKIKTECTDEEFVIRYQDNGAGLLESFASDPNRIFEYGTTSKYDSDGNQVGSGLGMYIFDSSVSDYNGNYVLTKTQNGFGIDVFIPRGGSA